MIGVIALNAGGGKILSAVTLALPWQAEVAPCWAWRGLSWFCHLQFWAAHAEL